MSVYLQTLLEGVPLPASRNELIAYAKRQEDGMGVGELRRLPDREFNSLDEVGEALQSVQVQHVRPSPADPRPSSGDPPGQDAYTDPSAEPGQIRKRGG